MSQLSKIRRPRVKKFPEKAAWGAAQTSFNDVDCIICGCKLETGERLAHAFCTAAESLRDYAAAEIFVKMVEEMGPSAAGAAWLRKFGAEV